jgi:CheY-like chemotaxis protein
VQYHSRSNHRTFGEQHTLFDRKPLRNGTPGIQIPQKLLSMMPTVLVADDNDDTRQMFQSLLAAKGYRVVEASDGEQAVEFVQQENPGLVLLDLGLPRLNGLNVIRRLRKELGLIDLPLVVVTGYDHHLDTAVAAGCDDYLLKPIDFDRLDAILDYYVPITAKAMSA